jgi:hypothetical protein
VDVHFVTSHFISPCNVEAAKTVLYVFGLHMIHVSELLAWLPLPGTPGNGMNDWSGSWSHSTIDTEYGILIICLNCFAPSSTMDTTV